MSKYNKTLREKVFTRDKWVCRVCGKQAHHTHHIVYRSHSGNHSEMNLISLCSKCHKHIHSDDKKWRPILITMQEEIYGKINQRDLKKADRYVNFKYSKY